MHVHHHSIDLVHASVGKIISTGLLLGIVHVLTGPDHLSALAAMSNGGSWRAFALGLRWGCGHSLGLIIMTAIFFAAGQTIDLDATGEYLNYVVGVFMIALGLWTGRNTRQAKPDETIEGPTTFKTKYCSNFSFENPLMQKVAALCVGIVHGIAGPGGILGVLPAVVLNNWGKSTAYLGSFCAASIFIMGVFAAVYGEITRRLGGNTPVMDFRVGMCSSAFSFIVGCLWIVLQSFGVLDDIFG
eukprot:jgi/Phyca11/12104/fgenesh1_pm.PHYCAscaffold_96_\